jgi:CheY-like chemotaxis protein
MDHGGTMTIALHDLTVTEEEGKQIAPAGRERLEAGRYVVLTVQDTGKGISKKDLPRIFEPFFTTKKFGGGMGLAVVFGIVKAHHGDITVYSEPGIGTAVKVYLPVALSAVDTAEPKTRAPAKGGTESILVVDDEEMLGRMLGRTLGRLGYRVTVKTSALEALEAVRASPRDFDLLVSDQTMPKMTGDQLAEEIHKIRGDFPIILCSGFSEILTPKRARELGIFKVVRKPFMNDDLEREIRSALDRAGKSSARASGPGPEKS